MIEFKMIDWETVEINEKRISKERFKQELLDTLENLTHEQYESRRLYNRHCDGCESENCEGKF